MSCTVEGNRISLTRGDSTALLVGIIYDDEQYTPQPGDKVRFALKRAKMDAKKSRFIDPEPLVEKDIPIDTMILALEPKDTKHLLFGDYVYDVEITFSDGFVETFIADAPFELTPEVH